MMAGKGTHSSFQKKGKHNVITIPGTRPSVHNCQLLTSVGIPSLDFLLGGGLPVGSILLIEQDRYDVYSKLFLKYFLAEGIVNNHILSVASLDESPENIASHLPSPCDFLLGDCSSLSINQQMTIAWRYQDQKAQQGMLVNNRFDHNFDLTKPMDNIVRDEADVMYWNGNEESCGAGKISNPIYMSLIKFIKSRIASKNLTTSLNKSHANIMRTVIHSLGSPLWGWEFSHPERDHEWESITTFFYILRAMARSSYSVTIVTIPANLFSDPALSLRLYSLSDFVVKLESFQGSDKETNPVFKDYHGLLDVKKLPAINTLVPHILDSSDWVFRLKKRNLTIERLHLPPDLSETVSRSQGDSIKKSSRSACMGESLPVNLDF